LQREKVRVYVLARELDIESKDLLDLCRQAGYDVKNQLSSLDPDQRDNLEQIIKRGAKGPTAASPAAPPKPTGPVLPVTGKTIPNLSGKPRPAVQPPQKAPPAVAPPAPVATPVPDEPEIVSAPPPPQSMPAAAEIREEPPRASNSNFGPNRTGGQGR